ncbi:MAG: bifunctional [glutamate--ammonia ligase]-adenylyl-L-tyrosine phosphorylase/[glutamate--ammonia-ligase] adenylyltransferase [Gammaproteobacteria bacterium]|nr:bifunctional [glutamate--ammonia ligase]-adenylyl-L-tyrosine phosphorylase/[glutamate--ammonia-ligase] adenylyltransferase [Gammaproteobacteria bacterium]
MPQTLPASLQPRVDHLLEQLPESLVESIAQDAEIQASLPLIFASSDFIAQSCLRQGELVQELVSSGDLHRAYQGGEIRKALAARLEAVEDETSLHAELRRYRRREMVRIAWRDIVGWSHLNETMQDLSSLADSCVDLALNKLHQWQCRDIGTPCNADGEPQQLVVVGMGKLGANELNYSSDIDLIYCFPEHGETRDGPRTMSNEQFFTRLGQRLTQAINNPTVDGFVFRVDLRLRPFGDSGPPVMSFDGMENYYTTHGREWERYAMIKARVIAGDQTAGQELMEMLRPFVFRRYLDFGSYENLRDMKEMIAREVTRKGMEDNVKLGPGGIREVEFIGQAFQLIRGGQDRALQERRILRVLGVLQERDILPAFVVEELIHSYIFLRDVEHRLQQWRDEQTQMLPRDEEGRLRLAYTMGFEDWEAFRQRLRQVMDKVHNHFMQVFEAPQTGQSEAADGHGSIALWHDDLDDEHAVEALQTLGYRRAQEALDQIKRLRASRSYRNLSKNGRERMDKLMPLLISAIGMGDESMTTLGRVLNLLETVASRSAYLALLIENPMALSQLVKLCSASPWISKQLTRFPLLLDELLDPRSLYAPPSRSELEEDLRRRLARIEADDLEEQMEALRHFHHANMLRVAAADVMEAIPLMVVSDHLTDIAEVVLEEVLTRAWWYMVGRHGHPVCTREGETCELGFAIVAYGKLGGIELGYGSDLDLVFLHDSESEDLPTTGEKSIPCAVFFARLAQRIIHMLSTSTPSGQLYEVDTRLRPSGASGLMVSSMQAFDLYQRDKAWTWEHQALVRARVVAGDGKIQTSFDAIRRQILSQKRDLDALRKDVSEMREKMRVNLGSKQAGMFDLKQDHGGIADIEFIVQYGVLAWSHEHSELTTYTDNMRILDGFAATGKLSQEEVDALQTAYKAYRQRVHRLKLQEQKALIEEGEFEQNRDAVSAVWDRLLAL